MIIEYILLILVVLCILFICYVAVYNKYQISIIRINEADANIGATLRKRFDLLNKSINIIKSNSDEENVLDIIKKMRSKKLNNFELDRELYEALNEFNIYVEKYPKLKSNEQIMNIIFGINESESEIIAFRKYYNDIISDYNKMVQTFPSNIIALFSNYKTKPYFDGKNEKQNDVKL